MRANEGELFVRHVGGHYYCAGLPEATLRYSDSDWNLPFRPSEVATAISNNRRAPPSVLDTWETYLCQLLCPKIALVRFGCRSEQAPTQTMILARNAGLRAIKRLRPDASVRLYEDVPYGAEFPEHTQRIVSELEHAGAVLNFAPEDVSDEFERKLQLLGLFASQFKVSAIQSGVEEKRSARRKSGQDRTVLEKVRRQPTTVPEHKIWINASRAEEIRAQLQVSFTSGAGRLSGLRYWQLAHPGNGDRTWEH